MALRISSLIANMMVVLEWPRRYALLLGLKIVLFLRKFVVTLVSRRPLKVHTRLKLADKNAPFLAQIWCISCAY
jgi:hypothetical protein